MDEKSKKRRHEVFEKVSAQIARIEQIIDDLMSGINIGEMTAYERLTIVNRFMGQQQRAIELQQTCLVDEPQNRESILVTTLMSQMRKPSHDGESEDISGPND